MLHYACLFMQNSCKLYTYSGKFPSLKRLYSGYGGKFLQEHLYIKLKVGAFPRGYIQPKLYPPLCQVSCTKNWTKLYGNLVCEIRWWIPSSSPPPHARHGCTPHSSRQGHAVLATRNNFSSYLRKAFLWASMANP